jgi:A/G-specific adenine glycosylase
MTTVPDSIKKQIVRRLSAWYDRHARKLPWRETSDPYRIWISEIMLQQTQVDTVIPYYHRFLENFPDVETLAKAPLEDVLKAWENLGYYSRARHLHDAAKIVISDFGGRIPDTFESIRKLPGIGPYSAGAVLSIAYGLSYPAVDGNIRRILCRLFAIQKFVDDAREQKELFALAASLVPAKNPGNFNQALMDLGAGICKPKNPACPDCPIAPICLAQKNALQEKLPLVRKPRLIPHKQSVCAVIENDKGQMLMVQRPPKGLLASLWKLPGGFVTDTEQIQTALKHRVREELEISIHPEKKLASVQHTYTHFRATLSAWKCRVLRGHPRSLGCQSFCWADEQDLKKLTLSKIDRMILMTLSDLRSP